MTPTEALDELEKFCKREGKSWSSASRFVRRLTEGLDLGEAIGVTRRLLDERRVEVSDNGSVSIERMVSGVDERRREVTDRLKAIEVEKQQLKVEAKQLDQVVKALNRITAQRSGKSNNDNGQREFTCECGDSFSTAQALGMHRSRSKIHSPSKARV